MCPEISCCFIFSPSTNQKTKKLITDAVLVVTAMDMPTPRRGTAEMVHRPLGIQPNALTMPHQLKQYTGDMPCHQRANTKSQPVRKTQSDLAFQEPLI